MMIFGIYSNGEEFGISNGNGIFWLFEGQQWLDEDVDLNQGRSFLTPFTVSTYGKDKIRIRNNKEIVAEYNVSSEVIGSLLKMKKDLVGL